MTRSIESQRTQGLDPSSATIAWLTIMSLAWTRLSTERDRAHETPLPMLHACGHVNRMSSSVLLAKRPTNVTTEEGQGKKQGGPSAPHNPTEPGG